MLLFAQEAHKKGDVLDARDGFGRSPLHLAIKHKYVQVTKKLIAEGADLFLQNNLGQSPLCLIIEKLPIIIPFLLDGAVSISGEILSESLFLNIDFG